MQAARRHVFARLVRQRGIILQMTPTCPTVAVSALSRTVQLQPDVSPIVTGAVQLQPQLRLALGKKQPGVVEREAAYQ